MGARTQKLDAVSRDVIGDNKSIVMPDPTWLFTGCNPDPHRHSAHIPDKPQRLEPRTAFGQHGLFTFALLADPPS